MPHTPKWTPAIADAIEYTDGETGEVFTGTIMVVDSGDGWAEARVRICWDDRCAPTWMRVSRVRQIC